MKKIISIPVYVLVTVLCSVFVVSCSDDSPVTPPQTEQPYEYDSARFDWKVDTLIGQGFIGGLWAPDTNEIFIPNSYTNTLVHIKNGIKTYTQYPEVNRLGAIYGDKNNNGYRVGAILIDTIYQPLLQRWDGSNFVDLNNPQNLDRNFFFWTTLIINPTEMWFGLSDASVVKFNGSDFTLYVLDNPDLEITKIFYDDFNRLKLLAYDPHYNIDRIEYFVYELRGSVWVKTYSAYNTFPLRYDVVGNKVAPVGLDLIYELADSVLIPKVNVPVYAFYLFLAGSSYNNIIIAASERFPEQNCVASLFHWNGKKWSLELCNYDVGFYVDILMVNENYFYAISYDLVWNDTYIMRGIKKYN